MLQLVNVILQQAIVILHKSYVILKLCIVCQAKYFCNITIGEKPAAKWFWYTDCIACLANPARFYVAKKVLPAVKNKKMPRFLKKILSFFHFIFCVYAFPLS